MPHAYSAARPPRSPRNRSVAPRPAPDRPGGGTHRSRGPAVPISNRFSTNEGAVGRFPSPSPGAPGNLSDASGPRPRNAQSAQLPRAPLSPNARVAQMLNLINSVSLNSATSDEQRQFQCKYLMLEDFQLYAYRHLKNLCERGQQQQALRLDLAMHPSLESSTQRDHFYDFLNRGRGGLMPPFYSGLAFDREEAARKLSNVLIDKMAAGHSSSRDKELFNLKWEFDRLSGLTSKRIEHYLDHGQTEKKTRLTDIHILQAIRSIMRSMKHAGEGQVAINNITATIADTATRSQKIALQHALSSSYQLSSDVEHIVSYFDQLIASPVEARGGGRLAAAWMNASRWIIDQIASKTATAEVIHAFGERLNESSCFQDLVLSMDEEYCGTRELDTNALLGWRRAGQLRFAVYTTDMLQPWIKEDLMAAFKDDPLVTAQLQVMMRQERARRPPLGSTRTQPTSPAPSPLRRGDRRPRLA